MFELIPIAFARVNGADGVLERGKNATSARAGAGDYNITIGGPVSLDFLSAWHHVVTQTISVFGSIVDTSDTVKNCLTENDASAATDTDFTYCGMQVAT